MKLLSQRTVATFIQNATPEVQYVLTYQHFCLATGDKYIW